MTKLRKRLLLALATAGMVSLSLLYAGCQSSPKFLTSTPWQTPTPTATPTPQEEYIAREESRLNAGIIRSHGVWNPKRTMDNVVRFSDAIVHARFEFAVQVVETERYVYPGGYTTDEYVGAVILTFDVLEYLKGSGPSQIEAVAHDADHFALTSDAVVAARHDLLELRDKQWDDRQAILFLSKHKGPVLGGFPSTSEYDNRYWLGYLRANGKDGFTVSSPGKKAWLPAVDLEPTNGQVGASGASGGTQRFFIDAPGGGASGDHTLSNSITLDNLKTFIADVEAKVRAGDESTVRIASYDASMRVIYATPSDVEPNPEYMEAVQTAVHGVRAWYGEQLEGLTFKLRGPVPWHCKLAQPAAYYAAEGGWDRVIADLQHCAPVTYPSRYYLWVIYVDAPSTCDASELGRGGWGVAILPRSDLDGLVSPETYIDCGYGPRGKYGWEGGLAHELGHALRLEHPPDCEEGLDTCGEGLLMWDGYAYDYPDTRLSDADIAALKASPLMQQRN